MEPQNIVLMCLLCFSVGLTINRLFNQQTSCAACKRSDEGLADPDLLVNAALNVINDPVDPDIEDGEQTLRNEAAKYLINQWNPESAV